MDLDLLCGATNKRCLTNDDGSLSLDEQGKITFRPKTVGVKTLQEFIATTKEGKEMSGLTGGIQGLKGTLFGIPYAPGSWQDKLIEAFSGTHDMVGGKGAGLYDAQGNATRNRGSLQKRLRMCGAQQAQLWFQRLLRWRNFYHLRSGRLFLSF